LVQVGYVCVVDLDIGANNRTSARSRAVSFSARPNLRPRRTGSLPPLLRGLRSGDLGAGALASWRWTGMSSMRAMAELLPILCGKRTW